MYFHVPKRLIESLLKMYVCMYVCIWTSTIQAFAFIGILEQGMTSLISCRSTEDARQAGR